MTFDNTNGTSFTIATDGVSGHGLTLNSGAGTGTTISVTAGNQTISSSLTFSDPAGNTFALSGGTSLTVTSAISGTSLALTGSGTLNLQSTNSYTGGTIVSGGVLRTTADNALGSSGTVR